MIFWLLNNKEWLFSGLGITLIGVLRAGYVRWRETRRVLPLDARYQTSHKEVRPRPLASRLPGFVSRLLFNPEAVRSRVKIALRDNAPGNVYLNSPVPSVELYFQVTNLSSVDLILDRMLVDVWFGQPTFSTALLHRYSVPAGEITEGLHVRQALAENQKAYITAFEAAQGNAGSMHIYVTAYFESALGRFFVQQSIERQRL